jgi:hypothetical protein
MTQVHFFGFRKDTGAVEANIGLLLRDRNNSSLSRSISVKDFELFVKEVVFVGHYLLTAEDLDRIQSPYIMIQSTRDSEAEMVWDMIESQNHHPSLVIGPALKMFCKAK